MERNFRSNFWMLLGFLAVLFLIFGLAHAGGGEVAEQPTMYIEGGWMATFTDDVITSKREERAEKIKVYLIIDDLTENEYGQWSAPCSVFYDKKMMRKVEGQCGLYPSYGNYVFLYLEMKDGDIYKGYGFQMFYFGIEMKGRMNRSFWTQVPGIEHSVLSEIAVGKITLRRIF